jgi:hypothetical protein
MAIFNGWMDDSLRGNNWAVGGYVGADHRWEVFKTWWPMALANHEVPYFHMREMANPKGVFAKWHPPEEHRGELADFFGGLAKVVRESCLVGILSLVRLNDLARFNKEHRQKLEPYPLAAYGCMLLAARDNPGMSTELVFDHCEGIASKLATAQRYAISDTYNSGDFAKLVASPLANHLTYKELPELQAADFFAWEYRKNHENVSGWFDLLDKPTGWDEQWAHFEAWYASQQSFGKVRALRKSAAALLDGNEFYPLIWDYNKICEANELRNCIWS